METLACLTVLGIPVALFLMSFLCREVKILRRLEGIFLWAQLALIVRLVSPVIMLNQANIRITDDLVIDRLSALFLVLTTLVAACSLSHAHLFFSKEETGADPPNAGRIKLAYACANLFLLSMTMVFISNNLGYLWIAIEATTLSSAPLVYFSRTKHALEATWKYLIICSVGIAFALLGTVLIFASSQHGAPSGGSLNLSVLTREAPSLQHPLLRLGFIFCLLGFGTKAGMFPIHSWLPDAHSEAPAPVSAMLSGSLLNCALFGIWKVSEIVVASRHLVLSENLLVWAGTLTVVAASLFLVRQHGFKRLWAYSSIENVGLMLVAIGIGSGALFFLQALNHSLAKVSLFLLSGNVIQATGTKELRDLKGVVRVSPLWAVLLALSAFAVVGAPPFGAFISEWLILTRTTQICHWVVPALLVMSLALSFIAVSLHLGAVLVGKPRAGAAAFRPLATSLIPIALTSCALLLGFVIAPGFLVTRP